MSEERTPYGKTKVVEFDHLSKCLCDNYSVLREVAEEMAEELHLLSVALEIHAIMVKEKGANLKIVSKELMQLGENAKSALEKFNKLKEK